MASFARLVNDQEDAGHHSVVRDAAISGQSAASGIYFYRIMTDSFSASCKMTLLK